MLALVAAARGADPSPGLALPSAAPAPAGLVEISTTGARGPDGAVGSALRVGTAPSERLWIDGTVFGAVGGPALAGVTTIRWLATATPQVAVAPVGALLLEPERPDRSGVAAGIAVAGGGDRVRADVSLLVGATFRRTILPLAEGGVSFRLDGHQTLRVGVVEILPDLSYRYEAHHWFVEAGVTGVPTLGGERLEVGVRF